MLLGIFGVPLPFAVPVVPGMLLMSPFGLDGPLFGIVLPVPDWPCIPGEPCIAPGLDIDPGAVEPGAVEPGIPDIPPA